MKIMTAQQMFDENMKSVRIEIVYTTLGKKFRNKQNTAF